MSSPQTFKEWFETLPATAKENYRALRKEQMKQRRDKTRKRKFTSRSHS